MSYPSARSAGLAGYGSTTPAQDGAENAQAAHEAARHAHALRQLYELAVAWNTATALALARGVPCPVKGVDWWHAEPCDVVAALHAQFQPPRPEQFRWPR